MSHSCLQAARVFQVTANKVQHRPLMDHQTSIFCFNQYWHWIKELPGTDMMLITVASALGYVLCCLSTHSPHAIPLERKMN